MRDTDIVVLSHFPEIFDGFRASVDADAPGIRKVVVWDSQGGSIVGDGDSSCLHISIDRPFQIAFNANAGWRNTSGDILYAGDDTRIIEPETIKRLRELTYSDEKIGILAPRISGESRGQSGTVTEVPFVPFVFVLIKREVVNRVGYMDEQFTGYGFDDCDYCYRTRQAGFKIAYANGVHIQHGVDGQQWGSTFKRVKTEAQMWAEDEENMKRFARNHGLPEDRTKVWEAIRK